MSIRLSDMDPSSMQALRKAIDEIQGIMITVSTGKGKIDDHEERYKELHSVISEALLDLSEHGVAVEHGNPFRSLWSWHGHWSVNLPSYATRRAYVLDTYAQTIQVLENVTHRRAVRPSLDHRSPGGARADLPGQIISQPRDFQLSLGSLHPKIDARCRVPFETGQFGDAISNAMKVVEEEVRAKIKADQTDIGVNLIAKAMGGRLPSLAFSPVPADQEAVRSLYRGAIGTFKNPLSRSFVDNTDPVKTFECLALASLLMRMVDETK